jgi:hypothetical protein
MQVFDLTEVLSIYTKNSMHRYLSIYLDGEPIQGKPKQKGEKFQLTGTLTQFLLSQLGLCFAFSAKVLLTAEIIHPPYSY